jgi:hypothetical protein
MTSEKETYETDGRNLGFVPDFLRPVWDVM